MSQILTLIFKDEGSIYTSDSQNLRISYTVSNKCISSWQDTHYSLTIHSLYIEIFCRHWHFSTTLPIRLLKNYCKYIKGQVELKIPTIEKHLANKIDNTYVVVKVVKKIITNNLTEGVQYINGWTLTKSWWKGARTAMAVAFDAPERGTEDEGWRLTLDSTQMLRIKNYPIGSVDT
jgi:hypothetical protein